MVFNKLQFIPPGVRIGEQSEFVLGEVTSDTVKQAIMFIESNAVGANGISKKMIVKSLPAILEPITELISKSIRDYIP